MGVPQGPLGGSYAVRYRAPSPPRPPSPCRLPFPHFTGGGTEAERSGDCLRPRGHRSGGSRSEPPGKAGTTPGPGQPPFGDLLIPPGFRGAGGVVGGSAGQGLPGKTTVQPEGPDSRRGTLAAPPWPSLHLRLFCAVGGKGQLIAEPLWHEVTIRARQRGQGGERLPGAEKGCSREGEPGERRPSPAGPRRRHGRPGPFPPCPSRGGTQRAEPVFPRGHLLPAMAAPTSLCPHTCP